MADNRWWQDFDTVLAMSLPPGSRILDVGCGDGGLVDLLTGLGFDAVGVDPSAGADRRLIPERVEDAAGLGEFDAVTAVMALHHANLKVVMPSIERLLRPAGQFFVYELAWDAYDERAAEWLASHDSSNLDNSVEGWRHEHRELHTGATIQAAVSASFEPALVVRRPYLARMLARRDLEAVEQSLLDAQLLPALGFWMTGERTDY
jgi:SAM-dependent methyltransferase